MTLASDEKVGVIVADTDALKHDLDADVLAGAAKADAGEHTMRLREAFRTHKRAILWSMALSAALIMEGYDVVVIASFYGHPAFTKRFGEYHPEITQQNKWIIPAKWQSGISNASSAGGILGLLFNGWAADRFGPKVVMSASLIALTGFIFILVFAQSLPMLVIGEVLCGIPWGVFQTLTTAYASEVCPIQLRGYLTAHVNLCWGVGILLASGVVKATVTDTSNWGWRLPFVLQWIWILPLLLIVYYAPPSPWWLVRKGRLAEAEEAIRRLTNPALVPDDDVKATVALMLHTNRLEIEASAGTSYLDCFRRTDRRRTEIVMMVFAMQLLSGQNLVGYGVQFLQNSGLSTDTAYSLSMVLNSMFIIGTIFSWGLLTRFGRRTIYSYGMLCMCIVLFIIGGIAFHGTQSGLRACGALLVLLNFVYNVSLGPICYTIIAEISSTRLRQKSIVLSRIAYQITNITCGIIVPRMLSPTAWNWGPKSGLFWGVSAGLCTLYCFLRLPESRGRSYGELDLLFERGIPAWRFEKTRVEVFAGVPGRDGGERSVLEDGDEKRDAEA